MGIAVPGGSCSRSHFGSDARDDGIPVVTVNAEMCSRDGIGLRLLKVSQGKNYTIFFVIILCFLMISLRRKKMANFPDMIFL